MDLFDAAAIDAAAARAPLADRMRPRSLDEVIGQDHLLAPGKPLHALVQNAAFRSVLLWGPPGVGKTSLARLLALRTRQDFVRLSAVSAGVKDVRELLERARRSLGEQGQGTILFLDEIHRFHRGQQDALLPSVENGLLTLVGATTENPAYEVNSPLLSRMLLFKLAPLGSEDLALLLGRALDDARGYAGEVTVTQDALLFLCEKAGGDARRVLNLLEAAVAMASTQTGTQDSPTSQGAPTMQAEHKVCVRLVEAEAVAQLPYVAYDKKGDSHYDTASAFIKAMRASDRDAALRWLARMLAGGEDARFIARRMIIFASEDVGMADPQALLVAIAAAQALEHVGLPEAQLNLAQAVVYLATAPKSREVCDLLAVAAADVESGKWPVPASAGRVPRGAPGSVLDVR